MKGLYITEDGKKEIEDIITELESLGVMTELHPKYSIWKIYKNIISSAIVLPVGKSWEKYVHPTIVPFFEKDLPNGVIIQPKS